MAKGLLTFLFTTLAAYSLSSGPMAEALECRPTRDYSMHPNVTNVSDLTKDMRMFALPDGNHFVYEGGPEGKSFSIDPDLLNLGDERRFNLSTGYTFTSLTGGYSIRVKSIKKLAEDPGDFRAGVDLLDCA